MTKRGAEIQAEGIGRRGKSDAPQEVASSSSAPPSKTLVEPSAYDIFQRTIVRAKNLVNVHEGDIECEEHHFDAFRAAVVLSISALDAYIRTLVVDKILNRLMDKDTKVADDLRAYIKNILNQDDLLEAGRLYEFRERVEKAIRADFETKSFQGEFQINTWMERAGFKDVFETVSHSADINKTRLRGDIESFTKRRHIIAHCGDFDLNQIPHSEKTIEKGYAEKCISIVSLFAEHINKIASK